MTNFQANSMNEQLYVVAKQAIAHILKQPIDDISCESLAGGSDESKIIKCTHETISYIVKFFSNKEFGKNEIAWTQHASDFNIGPRVYYGEPDGNYMVIDFVQGDSLIPATANKATIVKSTAQVISRLHNSVAPFAKTSDTFARILQKYKKLRCSDELKDILKTRMDLVENLEQQMRNYSVPPAPCHNDLNPGNVFAIDGLVTLIDWGDAALSDPYYDIAAFIVLNVIESENETLFFHYYHPSFLESDWQKYVNMCKQVVYFEFALNLLLGVQASNSELLYLEKTSKVNHLSYYLTLLATKEVKIDSVFLYSMAVASLNEMSEQIGK